MLLFHDNPMDRRDGSGLLRELKKRGYRVVHMVPGPEWPDGRRPPGWIL